MRFLVDAQLPPSLARWLCSIGCDAVHVEDVALRNVDDLAIRGYALRTGHVLVTQDRDFVPPSGSAVADLQVIWIRTGNISNRVLLERVANEWARVLTHLESGARIVELR